MMVKTTIRIPTTAHDDWDSEQGFLQKTITHDAPFTVGLLLQDEHLAKIDESGKRAKKPFVEKVSFNIDENMYMVVTTNIEINGKLLDRDKWPWISNN